MPEGPEARRIAVSLNDKLAGRTLLRIEYDSRSKYRNGLPGYDEFQKYLPARIEGVTCKGKCLLFILQSRDNQPIYCTSTLGMSGKWFVEPSSPSPHANLWFVLAETDLKLYYDDQRHFGNLALHTTAGSLTKQLGKIGPDYLLYAISLFEGLEIQEAEQIPYESWHQTLTSTRWVYKQICQFLMEPSIYSGIGNYLKSEILYRAKIRPDRKISTLSNKDCLRLYKTILDTIYDSFRAGGLTIRDFEDPDGKTGKFNKIVYNQMHDPLGNPVQKSDFADGRTTHWVPEVQV